MGTFFLIVIVLAAVLVYKYHRDISDLIAKVEAGAHTRIDALERDLVDAGESTARHASTLWDDAKADASALEQRVVALEQALAGKLKKL